MLQQSGTYSSFFLLYYFIFTFQILDIVDLTDEMLENGYYAALTKTASDLLKNFFKSLDKVISKIIFLLIFKYIYI